MAVALPTGYCLHCNYPLTGLPDPRCPECGSAFDPSDPVTFADCPARPWAPAVAKVAAALAAGCVVAALVLRPRLLVVWGAYAGLWLAQWFLLISFAIWASRRCRLRSLPWLAAYCAIRVAGETATPFLVRLMVDRKAPPFGWSLGETLAILAVWGGTISQAGNLLVTLVVLSEVAHLMASASAPTTGPLRVLLWVREKPMPFGMALVALAVSHVVLPLALILTAG